MEFNPRQLIHASLDICTKCQLRCPSCSNSKGIIRNGFVGEGMMSFDNFVQFLEMNPQIKRIELSNWGEIFLNPEIEPMMAEAYRRGIRLCCGNGANFNDVPDTTLEALVRYRFEYLNLSIDGATEDVYRMYRRGGLLRKVLDNIRKLNEFKALYGCQYPKLSWQFIVFGHNEHEISLVKRMCRELGMVFNPKMNHSDFSPINDVELVKRETGLNYASRSEYEKLTGGTYKKPCYQILYSPQINWNGDLLGCCVNKWGGFGNAFEKPLTELLNSRTYRNLIAALSGVRSFAELSPCLKCPNSISIRRMPLTDAGLSKYATYVPPALRRTSADIYRGGNEISGLGPISKGGVM